MESRYHSIALAGSPKAGKSTLLQLLKQALPDWEVRSVGDYLRQRHRKERSDITFEEYYKNVVKLEDLVIVNSELAERVEKGKIIADTRYVKPFGERVLKLFLTAPLDVRAKRSLHAYQGKTLEEVKEILAQREMDEMEKGRLLWGKDHVYTDLKHYHPHGIIDSSKLTPEQERDLILRFVKGE